MTGTSRSRRSREARRVSRYAPSTVSPFRLQTNNLWVVKQLLQREKVLWHVN